jgi:CheY-like chemotaxis protein
MPHILVVDDDHAICAALQTLLADEGYRVSCALDGAAALDAVALEPPDLIISDLMMPRMDGWTLLQRLRETHSQIPVLLMSAADKPANGFAFVSKPFAIDRLLVAIARLLG